MEGKTFIQVLADTGIAATLIRKVVELGGDKTRITILRQRGIRQKGHEGPG